MNQRDVGFVKMVFPKFYGRPGSTTVDIKELNRCLETSAIKATNPFLNYAISEKSDEDKRQDNSSLAQMLERINQSIQAANDPMSHDLILQTLDADKDGLIGLQDILGMQSELGLIFPEGLIQEILEKVTATGRGISKEELVSILWH